LQALAQVSRARVCQIENNTPSTLSQIFDTLDAFKENPIVDEAD